MANHLTPPYGGKLVNLMADSGHIQQLKRSSISWVSVPLNERQMCDLELLMNGALSPLRGFMNRRDYESVSGRMRLYSEAFWPMPVVLDVSEETAEPIEQGQPVALLDPGGRILAYLDVEDKWKPDRLAEADTVYGTTDRRHPGVCQLLERFHPWYLGGRLVGIEPPRHIDFLGLRHTPAGLREQLGRMGWQRVVGFPTRRLIHRAQFELTLRIVKEHEASLLIHPIVGPGEPNDVEHFHRLRCYQAALSHYPPNTAMLSLLPLASRQAGAREALLQAIIHRNYGCSHFLLDPDPGEGEEATRGDGEPALTRQEDALDLVHRHAEELGVVGVPYRKMAYVEDLDTHLPADEVPAMYRTLEISEADLAKRLAGGQPVPLWFTFPEVAARLIRAHPPRARQGFTVFFTGLAGSGKSTLARTLLARLLETGDRAVSLLDDDEVRGLFSETGASRGLRETDARRIGFLAAEINRSGGIAICAPLASSERARQEVRKMIGSRGGFCLIYVSTPPEVCRERSRDGQASRPAAGGPRSGSPPDSAIPAGLPGSQRYEPPQEAHLTLDTSELNPEEAVQRILLHLQKEGYIAAV